MGTAQREHEEGEKGSRLEKATTDEQPKETPKDVVGADGAEGGPAVSVRRAVSEVRPRRQLWDQPGKPVVRERPKC